MSAIEWHEVDLPRAGPPGSTVFRHLTRPLVAIRSRDDFEGDSEPRWHLSVSHQSRIPTWEELGLARDALLPEDLHFMVPHPPRRYWLNYDHRVLHLIEMRDPVAQQQFEWEGEQAQKSGKGRPS